MIDKAKSAKSERKMSVSRSVPPKPRPKVKVDDQVKIKRAGPAVATPSANREPGKEEEEGKEPRLVP